MLKKLLKSKLKLKNGEIIGYILMPLVFFQQVLLKKSKKLMKIVNIDGETLDIFWTTWGISVKLSWKM